ncbi:MAG: type II toxin-antitoxin system VapC family toxin [Chloroflexi bacterium]|nr:type II toxin-antitoxin system VapC family toxin [Chloroflexota bacterium]
MKVLIDTHTFLWWNIDDPQLSLRAKDIISDGQNEIFLSAASVWEIIIKTTKGKLVLPEAPAQYMISRMSLYRFRALPIQISHSLRVYELPPIHNDPFDRMLISQSQVESMPLLTKDENIQRYDLETIW